MNRLFDGIIRWSIDQRAIVVLTSCALAVLSLWMVLGASLDVLPEFTPPRVVVQTEAPGMGTTDVEQLVTAPLERALLATPDVTSVRADTMPGLSVTTLLFRDDVDVYRARQLVSERLQLVRGVLPRVVKDPKLEPVSSPIGALLKFTLSGPEDAAGLRRLRTFADWTLKPRLLAISGISQVQLLGGGIERIEVRPDPAQLIQRDVTLADLERAVSGSQAIEGLGFVDRGSARLDIVADARLSLEDAAGELSRTVIALRNGFPIRVGDVAEVVTSDEPPVGGARYDAQPAVYVQVMKLPSADTTRVTAEVERALDELKQALPPGAHMDPPVYRQATFVHRSVWSVGRAMLLGSALVVLVLITFLRRGRLAAITLTAIPLSILIALAILVALGASINGMILGGLAIAVGEVVDDGIVDVENVWRRLRENARREKPRPALDVVHDASQEVRGAVVYATIIVCLMLLPVLAMGGIAGRIFSPLAHAYILAILASLVVALTITPALCAILLPKIATHDEHLPRTSRWLLDRYHRLLARAVAHPRPMFIVSGVLAAGALVALFFVSGRFLPEFHEETAIAHINALPGTSLDETLRLGERAGESIRAALPGAHIDLRAGRTELGEDTVPVNQIEMDVLLPKGTRGDWEQIADEIGERIGRVPGVSYAVEGFLSERIHENLSGQTAPVVVKLFGPELDVLRTLAARTARIMDGLGQLEDIRPEPQIDVAELQVRPRREELARWGLRPADVIDAAISLRQGRPITQVLGRTGRVVDVVIAGPDALRRPEALANLPIETATNAHVALGELADIRIAPTPALVHHEAGSRRVAVVADVRGSGLSRAAAHLQQRLERELHLPAGYRFEVAGEAAARREAATRLVVIGLLVLAGVFGLLATAFGSMREAAIVLLNFPLGLIGGVLVALLQPEGLSVAGLVGFVTLFGIISRNGIMLVSHKHTVDKEAPNEDAVARILRASEERLLPILMTAACAGLGLLPLALSVLGSGSELESPMALIVCGGLITSTALNMLLLPTVYVWLARRRTAA